MYYKSENDQTEYYKLPLWNEKFIYDICFCFPGYINILGGAEQKISVISLTIPGATELSRKFRCPKCLELHKFPEMHGASLECHCGAIWSFGGAGVVSPKGETHVELKRIVCKRVPDLKKFFEKDENAI